MFRRGVSLKAEYWQTQWQLFHDTRLKNSQFLPVLTTKIVKTKR